MFKISKTQQVALCLALTLQLCFIWVCLPVHPLCLCVCLAFGRIIYALSGLPFRIILRSLAQSSGLQSVFPGSALICFTAFLWLWLLSVFYPAISGGVLSFDSFILSCELARNVRVTITWIWVIWVHPYVEFLNTYQHILLALNSKTPSEHGLLNQTVGLRRLWMLLKIFL